MKGPDDEGGTRDIIEGITCSFQVVGCVVDDMTDTSQIFEIDSPEDDLDWETDIPDLIKSSNNPTCLLSEEVGEVAVSTAISRTFESSSSICGRALIERNIDSQKRA